MPAAQTIDDLRALERLISAMPAAERAALEKQVAPVLAQGWVPLPGQQALAYESEADILGYGGSAGGGKSSLLIGTAISRHHRSLIVRREASELDGLIAESRGIIGERGSWNGQDKEWTLPSGKSIKFGGMKEPDDWRKYAGRARDLIGVDEACEFLELQIASLMAWLRSPVKGQRKQLILATNPPRSTDGEWFLRWFAPWLDPKFPDPAAPGELRYAIRVGDRLEWQDGPEKVIRNGEEYEPYSYTFIPASLDDNPFLSDTEYRKNLQNLPGALRDQLLKGDFLAGRADDEWQIIPTEWVRAAQARWTPDGGRGLQMTAMGADVAQGGDDKSVLAPRYGVWYAPLQRKPGKDTPTSADMVAFILAHLRGGAGVVIDIGGGYGIGPAVHIKENGGAVVQFDGSKPSTHRAAGSNLQFFNKRAEAWWRFREALDPGQEGGSPIALPADPSILGDLTAPRYELLARGIKVEAKTEVKKRIGRSPDDGDAIVMAWSEGQALAVRKHARGATGRPQVVVGYQRQKKR